MAILHARPRVQPAGRDVDDDVVLALLPLHDPIVERPGHERDRAVPTGGRIAGVVEEDDPEVCAVVVRRDDEAAVHVGVAAGLEDEEPADVVEPLERVAPPVEDGRAARLVDAARDDPERLASGVVVDRGDRRHSGTLTEQVRPPTRKISMPFPRPEDGSTLRIPMNEDDTQPETIAGERIPLPLCDDEDEPVARAQKPPQLDASGEEVEGHGGWDFDRIE
jgi:hypothetical protein